MDGIAIRLDVAAAALHDIERELHRCRATAVAFGADADGLPGRVGRTLHDHWADRLATTARHAAELANRSADIAAAVRAGRDGYADADEAAGRRLRREA